MTTLFRSDLQEIETFMFSGVTTLSKKLCSECKDKNCAGKKQEPGVAKKTIQQQCNPCKIFQKPEEKPEKSCTSSLPGCMPFTDDEPVRPIYPPDTDESGQKRTCVSIFKK